MPRLIIAESVENPPRVPFLQHETRKPRDINANYRVVRERVPRAHTGCVLNKSLIGIAAIAVTISAPALAADIPLKAPPAPVCTWCGFYIGINGGGDWGASNFNWNLAPGFIDPAAFIAGRTAGSINTFRPEGFTGGGQIGYNWQSGQAVYGLEADLEYLGGSASRSVDLVAFGLPGPGMNFANESVKSEWLSTFRGRLGWAAGPALLYATGGLAVGTVQFFDQSTYPVILAQGATTSPTMVGYTAGGGVEYATSPHWILRAEYLYVNLGHQSVTSTNTTAGYTADVITFNHNYSTNIGRVGISYKFGGP